MTQLTVIMRRSGLPIFSWIAFAICSFSRVALRGDYDNTFRLGHVSDEPKNIDHRCGLTDKFSGVQLFYQLVLKSTLKDNRHCIKLEPPDDVIVRSLLLSARTTG
ncbi:MAG: hypothetical protein ACE5H0_06165 [Bacteroidota bacterium]